jgi:hypothetical protein
VTEAATAETFQIRGAYFESCNCDAICPCRMVGGVPGGRSTHGVCYGVLGWLVDHGWIRGTDVSGLAAAIVYRYDDDEPRSPWTFTLHVDERGDEVQRQGLASVFLGELGGPHVSLLPWIRKTAHVLGVHATRIELTPDGAGYRLRVGQGIHVRASRAFETDEGVACGIPGYERHGYELVADEHVVADGPFAWELSGNCGYTSDFDYRSA